MANHNGAYYNQVVDSINKHDSINQTIVLSIVKQYGWPSSTYVGEFESIVFFLVIQHAGLKIQEEFLPFLIGLTYSNDFEKKDLAYLADRILMKNHHHQVFGTQLNLDSMTTTAICNSCQFPGYVNVLRREFCLGSLEDYIKQSNEMYLKK